MAFEHSAGISKVYLDNASGTPVDFTQYLPGLSTEATLETADSTSLADTARAFVTGLEDGGETSVDIMLDTGNVVWTQLLALYNARYLGTLTAAPTGITTGDPKIMREVRITKLGIPQQVDGVAKVSVTLKASGPVTHTSY